MASTNLTQVACAYDTGVTAIVGTLATCTTTGFNVTSISDDDDFLFFTRETSGTDGTLSVTSSDTFNAAGIGNLTLTVEGETTQFFGPFTGARFMSSVGTFTVTCPVASTHLTGDIGVITLPK